MRSRLQIIKLADKKLAAARSLVQTGHFDDAYYLAGYSIELYLKAVICKTLGIDEFFLFAKLSKKENYRAFKSHNYNDLFVLSGIYPEFMAAQDDAEFAKAWNKVKDWTENARYVSDQDPAEIENFVNSSEIICVWIQKHL